MWPFFNPTIKVVTFRLRGLYHSTWKNSVRTRIFNDTDTLQNKYTMTLGQFISFTVSASHSRSKTVFWETCTYICTADWFPYKYGEIQTGRQDCLTNHKNYKKVEVTVTVSEIPLGHTRQADNLQRGKAMAFDTHLIHRPQSAHQTGWQSTEGQSHSMWYSPDLQSQTAHQTGWQSHSI